MFKPPGGGLQVNKLNGRRNVFITKFSRISKELSRHWGRYRYGSQLASLPTGRRTRSYTRVKQFAESLKNGTYLKQVVLTRVYRITGK